MLEAKAYNLHRYEIMNTNFSTLRKRDINRFQGEEFPTGSASTMSVEIVFRVFPQLHLRIQVAI